MNVLDYDKQLYRPFLAQLFGDMSEQQLGEILAITQILDFDAGEYVFQQNDTNTALYIVFSGRLRVIQQTENHTFILGDVSAGEPVGELALFTKEPRSASVVALRKSTVLQLDEANYLSLVQQFPAFANSLTQFVIQRLRRNGFQQKMGSAPKNIAVINLQAPNDMSPWTENIKRQFAVLGVEIRIYDHLSQTEDNPQAVFDEMEKQSGINFLVCNDEQQVWANQCLTYCDLVVVATEFHAKSSLYAIEKHLNLYTQNILNKKIYLLFLHPENAPLPTHTRRWFEGRNLDLHLHIRKNNVLDIRRFCRIVSHQAIGLVLGGGGAKGFAHIGAAKALLESGIEFDFVGGTSAGALYGAAMTHSDFDMLKINHLCRLGAERKVTSNDYHFPFLSLMTGKKMRKYLKDLLGETYLEDLWVNTYTVSTNYSTASMKIHDTGLARLQVEASIAIPGVFPPVIIDNHLHVDGGVMDNLPIEAMYQKPVRHVIAVALTAQAPHLVEIQEMPTASQLFWNKITQKRRHRLPSMSSLLVNSMTLNSRQKQETTKLQVALYLEMDLHSFNFLDWSKWEELIGIGYEQTQVSVKNMPEKNRFWK